MTSGMRLNDRKMPDSAFFESRVPAWGDKRKWHPIAIGTAAVLVLALSVLIIVANTYVTPPEPVLMAALLEDTGIAAPEAAVTRMTIFGYSVTLIGSSLTPARETAVITVDRAARVVAVRHLMGDPRPSYVALRFAGYAGVAASLASLFIIWRKRRIM